MSDLIDREAAINFIKQYQCSGCSDIGLCGKCAVLIALKLLEKVPAAPRWVRCEEEPKEDGDYLTYYVDGYCAVNHWSKGWGWMYDEEAVRYWMLLPEPPKEDA